MGTTILKTPGTEEKRSGRQTIGRGDKNRARNREQHAGTTIPRTPDSEEDRSYRQNTSRKHRHRDMEEPSAPSSTKSEIEEYNITPN